MEALRQAELRATDLVRFAPTGIYEIDFATNRFTTVNDALVSLSGYSREELLSMDAASILDQESRGRFAQRVARSLAGEALDEQVEYRCRRKDGSHIYVVLQVRFRYDDEGRAVGAFVVGHDVTERLRTEDALKQSQERFRILSEANTVLLSAQDPEAVIQAIAEQVMRHLGGDVFFNYVLVPDRSRLRLNAWAGVDERIAKMIESLELGQAICGCVARDGQRIISRDVQNNGDARADLVRRMGVRCYVCHPLIVDGQTVGTLSFGTKQTDSFADDEIEFMRTVANQISIAIRNAQLLAAEREESRLSQSMVELNADLSSTLGIDEVLPSVLERVLVQLAGDGATITRRIETGWLLRCNVGGVAGVFKPGAVFSDDEAPALEHLLATKQPMVVEDTLPGGTFNAELAERAKTRAFVQYPLIVRGEVTGAITVQFPAPRSFTPRELDYVRRVAFAISLAEANAQLYAERTQRAHYAQALHRIDSAIHSSLEFDEIMERIVVEITEALGVDVSAIHRHLTDHWDFTHTFNLPEAFRRLRVPDDEANVSMHVLRTRQPLVSSDVNNDARVKLAAWNAHGVTAFMAVPLIMRGEVIGVLYTGCLNRSIDFDRQQLDFVSEAANSLALALENARLYETEHGIADKLQEAMLSMADDVPGVEFAHAYHSATRSARVGGDFYDLFELSHDHIAIVIGDVAGKGLDAAVLASVVKNTIRAHASERGKTPRQVMALVNDVVYRTTPPEAFVTVFFGILDVRDGRLVYVNGGHTTAAVVLPDGSVSKLPTTGPMVGAFPDVWFNEAESLLEPDRLLFLYTDGLTEARGESRMYGETRVFERLHELHETTPTAVVQALIEDVLEFSHVQLRDDLAMLAVRRVGLSPDSPHQEKLPL
jgi:PAS domain S-box-containing protein